MNIGRWRLVEQPGADALGTVHLAVDAHGTAARARLVPASVLAASGARDRVLALAQHLRQASNLPGIVAAVDVVESSDGVWLITEQVVAATVHELLAAATTPGAPALHHLLVDSAYGCLTLHSWGVAHGAVSEWTVSAGIDGSVRLLDPMVLALATGFPASAAGDASAWAALARTLRSAWLPESDAYALSLLPVIDHARAGDLRQALDQLQRNAELLPGRGQSRVALRTAVAEAVSAPSTPQAIATVLDRPTPVPAPAAGTTRIIDTPPAVTPGAATRILDAPTAGPAVATGLVAFGSGPPPPEDAAVAESIAAAVAAAVARRREAAGPPPVRRRRRGRAALGLFALLVVGAGIAASAVVLRNSMETAPAALAITSATVSPDRATISCGDSPVVFTATLRTNAASGTVTYRWERADSTQLPSGVQAVSASDGSSTLRVTLTDQTSGRGRLVETARIHVLTPVDLVSTAAEFVYDCR